MGDEQLAGLCTGGVGVSNSAGALWSLGGGTRVFCVAVRCACFVGGNLFCLGWFCVFIRSFCLYK